MANKKFRRVKKVLTVLAIIPLVLIHLAIIFNLPTIIYLGRTFYTTLDIEGHQIDIDLTMEQKLEDLDYMYEIVCLGNPNKEYLEQLYGISYDDIYNRYRQLVIDSKTDYEYFSIMACFLGVLPGQHNAMMIPNYQQGTSSFLMIEQLASQKMRDYAYSWKEAFRDEVLKYREYGIIGFRYMDGKYIGIHSDSTLMKFNNTYGSAQLLTIDGKDPVDLCFDYLLRESVYYDEGNDCFIRRSLYFNDGIGEPHTAEILMPDGEIVTTTIYEAPGFEIAMADGISNYPEEIGVPDVSSAPEDETSEDSMYPVYHGNTYMITADPDRNLVYVDCDACDTSEGEKLAEDLTEALALSDADYVILDLRSNGGGSTSFCNEQVLPVLFSHDLEYPTEVVGLKNDYTKRYYNDLYYHYYIGRPLTTDEDHYYVHEDFNVEGRADKDYKIYVLTSRSTFSSADLMVCLCKEYDNATIVGTNTGGEGICGTPYRCYLPNSHFVFTYTPTSNTVHPEDTYLGTSPDIYIASTPEEYYMKMDLYDQGLDYEDYEIRQAWDGTLNYVLDLIDGE